MMIKLEIIIIVVVDIIFKIYHIVILIQSKEVLVKVEYISINMS